MLDTAASQIKMNRVWAMPSADTLTIPPFRQLVKRYLHFSKVSVDPFARNCRWATYTNDLNPDTAADYHLPALQFLQQLVNDGVRADLVIFDPPYSLRQVKECYQAVGIETMAFEDTHGWKRERDLIAELCEPNAIALSFGWNSQGIGQTRGFEIQEVLLVSHGRDHNDTICTVERKLPQMQGTLLDCKHDDRDLAE